MNEDLLSIVILTNTECRDETIEGNLTDELHLHKTESFTQDPLIMIEVEEIIIEVITNNTSWHKSY